MTGDSEFERLVESHYAALYRFAYSLTGKETEAFDLTQQTFLIWAKKGYQLKNPSKAKSWLFTSLHREFLLLHRRRTRFPHQDLDASAHELPNIEPHVVSPLDAATVVAKLNQVEEVYQAPVALFYLENYSYREIGEILGIPLGTVKSRIARGVARLQSFFHRDRSTCGRGAPLDDPNTSSHQKKDPRES